MRTHLFFLALCMGLAAPASPVVSGVDVVTGTPVPRAEGPRVVLFLSSQCPCSKSHEEGLAALAREFRDVSFVGVSANAEEPLAEVKRHFARVALPFPVVRDEKGTLTRELGALKTPHAFFFGKDGTLLFAGGVDDSTDPKRAKHHYLRDALRAHREGRKPETDRARPLGCAIEPEST